MNVNEPVRCSLAAPGVEVVTVRVDGAAVSTIHGGKLDGEEFKVGGEDADNQHYRACVLARLAKGQAWEGRRSYRRRMVLGVD